jgi:hypothetical protein
MERGDLPTTSGSGSFVVFEDGAKARMNVIAPLRREGVVDAPRHCSVFSPWTLGEAS